MTAMTMRPAGLIALALLFLTAPSRVLAKDICVRDSDGGSYRFSKVQTLRPGRVVPLAGFRVSNFPLPRPLAPVHGTAAMGSDGIVRIGVLVHGMSTSLSPGGSSTLVSIDADQAFSGTGTFDATGDFRPTNAVTWTPIDCDTVDVP
jgi:hypothetical protein